MGDACAVGLAGLDQLFLCLWLGLLWRTLDGPAKVARVVAGDGGKFFTCDGAFEVAFEGFFWDGLFVCDHGGEFWVLVCLAGVEPATDGVEDQCSIQLSYRQLMLLLLLRSVADGVAGR